MIPFLNPFSLLLVLYSYLPHLLHVSPLPSASCLLSRTPPGDGYITTQVLKEILKELDNKLSDEDLDGIIEEIDEDGSGTVDFDGE